MRAVRTARQGRRRPPARPAGPMAMPVACMVQQQRQGVRHERGNQLPGRWDEGQAMAFFEKKSYMYDVLNEVYL